MAERGVERFADDPTWVVLDWLADYLFQQPAFQSTNLAINSVKEINITDIPKGDLPALYLYPVREVAREAEIFRVDARIWIIVRQTRADIASRTLGTLKHNVWLALNSLDPRRLSPREKDSAAGAASGWPDKQDVGFIGMNFHTFVHQRTFGSIDPYLADGTWQGTIDYYAPKEWAAIGENYE